MNDSVLFRVSQYPRRNAQSAHSGKSDFVVKFLVSFSAEATGSPLSP